MWNPVELPFKCDSSPPLPTVDEIRSCSDVIQRRSAKKVVAINDKVVAKFGGGIDVAEGQALIFLERHAPGVPAPKLHAMFRDGTEVFLIMERAPGLQLDAIWPSLTESEKSAVTSKLSQIFDSMRQVECPWPDFFGGLGGGSLRHYLFYSQKGDFTHLGPLHGNTDFVKSMVANFRALVERNGRADYKVRFYEEYLAQALGNFRPTLTHGDVQKKNIMVAEIEGGQENGERTLEIVLVDWEAAGWYPDFWEFFCASSTFDFVYWEEDWCWCAKQFLQVRPAEFAMMRMFDKDMAL
jgi:hypothetical protein